MMDTKHIQITSQSDVCTVAFAGESQVIGGHRSGEIRRWKIEDGQQQGPVMRGSGEVWSIAISQDGRWIVSGDEGKKASVWNAATHERVLDTEHDNYIWSVDVSSDGTKFVAACYYADTVRMFGVPSGTELFPPLAHRRIDGVKFSPDGSRFATASYNSGFRIYSTHNGDILFDSGTQGSTDSSSVVAPLAWSSDGQQLFVASKGKITCFDVSDSSSSEWSIRETQSSVSIASNGRFIACSAGKSVSIWGCVSHKQIGSTISHTAIINSIALSPSGGYLACGFDEGKIVIHNLRDAFPLEYFGTDLPLIQMSGETFKSWAQDNPTNAEMLLSKEITSTSSPSHYPLANRALIRARLKQVVLAAEDAKKSLQVRPSPIGYVAMAVVLLAQGDQEGALRVFDLAFHDCELDNIRFLLLLKSILVFESGNQEDAITRAEHLVTRANDDNDDDAIRLYTQVLGVMYMKKEDYERAIPLIERVENLAPKDKQCPPLMTISLIFWWSFIGLGIVARQRLCETLYAEGRTTKAVEILLDIIRRTGEETQRSKATAGWVADFTQKCAATLERVGDEALTSAKHDGAIAQYSVALSLGPPSPEGLLIKRSRARAAKGLWEDALLDANEAVKANSSIPWGYEAKRAALHGAKRYDEAIDAFESMLHAIEQSHDSEIRQLRNNYIPPSQTIAVINSIAQEILKKCPLVVIDMTTGCLCDGPKRMCTFVADPLFKELVSSTMTNLDDGRIREVVGRYFGFVMFSHVWQGNEPSFQEVNVVESVWKLPDTPLNEKLRNFCKEAHRHGHNWAWSDTCCIDKATSSILNQSLTSMYKWYADSAATLVFLADVAHPSKPGDLMHSLWMTRAWSLQELLAPKIIFFYDSKWKPYLGNIGTNHKESPEIIQELADAIKIPYGTVATFSPDNLAIREKLRLASTRSATIEEDVAYSLIGIFKSNILPHYGEGADALGHLLEEIVARSGDVTVLAWSGKSSPYNSCLPASISVYNQTPYHPPSLKGEELETHIVELQRKWSQEVALSICNQIDCLPPALFGVGRLLLPCLVFSIRKLIKKSATQEGGSGNEQVYRARVSGLGDVEFMTAVDLTLDKQKKFIFARPWIRHIRGPHSGVTGEDDSESDTDADTESNLGGDKGWDEVTSSRSVAAAPQVGSYVRALQMIARLGQPFNVLLLVQQLNGEYKRVATEYEIVVLGLGMNITPKHIRAKVLEVL